MAFIAKLLLFLATLSIASSSLRSVSATSLRFENNLGGNFPMKVKCHWKSDDMGARVVAPRTSFEFFFSPDMAGGAVWYCGVAWEHGSGVYDVFTNNRDIGRCNTCVWKVKPDGLDGLSESARPQVYFKWQATN